MSLTVDKSKKYDRQIRLWGEHGQIALENANICLIGSNGVGTEILKNLILPGVGQVTIVDDSVVMMDDLSNNFFVTENDCNQSRAAATARLLRELNDEVTVIHVDDSIESILSHKPGFFIEFSVVIACGLNNKDLVNLDRLLYPENIALIVCYSLGMVASLRVIIREHNIWDSKPDNLLSDLRLDRPLPQFIDLCATQNMDKMSHKDIAHCPWLIILYKYLQSFQEEYGRWPESFKDKCILKGIIKERAEYYQKLTSTGDNGHQSEFLDSFDEAQKAVSTSLTKTEVPSNVAMILNDPRSVNINKESRPFWVLVSALKEFVRNEGGGVLPLRGDIPDMTADTSRYISIQRIYHDEAERHATAVEKHVVRLCQTFQIQVTEELSTDSIRRFVRNCHHIGLVSSYSLERELKTSPSYTEDLICMETAETSWYLAVRAAVAFLTVEGRWPGQKSAHPDSDLAHLRRLLQRDLDGCARLRGASVRDEYLLEVCRYGGAELHSVSAFLGGVAAQEVVKLLTGMYVPVVRPLIYCGISQTASVVDL